MTKISKEIKAARSAYRAASKREAALHDKKDVDWLLIDQAGKATDSARVAYERRLGRCPACDRNPRHVNADDELMDTCMACTWTDYMLQGGAE